MMIDIVTYRQRIGMMPSVLQKITRQQQQAHAKRKSEYFTNKGICEYIEQYSRQVTIEHLIIMCSVICLVLIFNKHMCRSGKEHIYLSLNASETCCKHGHIFTEHLNNMFTMSANILCGGVCLQQIGAVHFIAILLQIGGIETNPGPTDWQLLRVQLESTQSFEQLHELCRNIVIPQLQRCTGHRLKRHYMCDQSALRWIPTDCPITADQCFPVKTSAIGNCFPACLSRLVYGTEDHTTEMRVRVVVEGVLHYQQYLDDNYLAHKLTHPYRQNNISERYCTYSKYYQQNVQFTRQKITEIYQMEIWNMAKDVEYCGIWQFHQAANVLQVPIFSVYPDIALQNLRGDFHRIIFPKNRQCALEPCVIMWTTATSMSASFNHFVPLVR